MIEEGKLKFNDTRIPIIAADLPFLFKVLQFLLKVCNGTTNEFKKKKLVVEEEGEWGIKCVISGGGATL